eukprot:COSAG06_NODE_5539_length_3417_cov_6.462327_4_plen_58_part_01
MFAKTGSGLIQEKLKNVCAGGFDGVEGISIDSIGTVGPLGLSVGECIMILWVDSVMYA